METTIFQPIRLLYRGLTSQDEKTKALWLFNNPWLIYLILSAYLAISLRWGPAFMKNRKAFHVKPIARLFNVLQVILNTYIFIEITKHIVAKPSTLNCLTEGVSNLEGTVLISIYSRLLDLLDTMLFILSKKERNVSTLHVYHHFIVIVNTYFVTKAGYGMSLLVIGFLNTFVHMIMYSYYLMATYPSLRPFLWWKKHLTKLQLLQFVLVLVHTVYQWQGGCTIPMNIVYNYGANSIIFLYLFGSFYMDNYTKKKAL